MGSWIKGLILIAFALAVFLGRMTEPQPSALSVEDYWASTGVTDQELFDFLDNQFCHSSERYFLACANALQQVAARNNYQILPTGQLVERKNDLQQELSEPILLRPWKVYFQKVDQRLASEIDFVGLWEVLKKAFFKDKKWSTMIGAGLNGFLSVFRDPHTYLIPVDYYRQVLASPEHRVSSYGLFLTKMGQNLIVKKVIPNSPAQKLGIRKGDKILSLNGEDANAMSLFEANQKLKNVSRKSILIKKRDSNGQIIDLNIPKSQQALSTVHLDFLEQPQATALLTIDRFSRNACEKVKLELEKVKKKNTQNLIIDLRDNPGGQMDETGCIAGLFTGPHRRIFSVRYMHGNVGAESYFSEMERIFSGRIIVLINRGTASAAEILAGSLRELGRAILVGERTFGKGSFQEGDLWKRNNKIALFETKGFYYLPSGFSPQKVGLIPDIAIEPDVAQFDRVSALGSREENQYWLPLETGHRIQMSRPMSGIKIDKCLSHIKKFEANPEDPEMSQAQVALGCWESAQLQGATGHVSDITF